MYRKPKKSIFFAGFMLVAMCIALAGCFSASGIKSGSDDTSKGSDMTEETNQRSAFHGTKDQAYFMCVFKKNTPYWKGVFKGFQAAGDQLGVRTVFVGCDEYDTRAQLRVFDEIVAKKPKGIAIHPINPEIFTEPINKAISKGIKVTCFAADSPGSKRMTLVTSDNLAEGKFAADYIAEKLGKQMEIGIIERPNQTNHVKRVEAFIARLREKYPGMKVVARETADGDETKAASVAGDMIHGHPDISLIYCVASIEGMGAGAAVKESGRDIKVFCFDADPEVIDMIKDGTIFAAIHPNTVNQGYWSMMCLYVAANNLINPVSDWKPADKSPLPVLIDNGFDVVTRENCDFFYVK